MSETQEAWLKVITTIPDDFPTSAFSKLDAQELEGIAVGWAEKMAHVPADQVLALYNRAIRDKSDSFPPNIGELAATWNAWQRTEYEERRYPKWNDKGSHLQEVPKYGDKVPDVSLLHLQRLRQHKGVIACKCMYPNGDPCGASLVNLDDTTDSQLRNPTHWVCNAGRCDFCLPVALTPTAPSTPMGQMQAIVDAALGNATPDPEPAKAKKFTPRKLTFFEQIVEAWNINIDAASEMDVLKLRGFLNRWQAVHKPNELPTPDDLASYLEAQLVEQA